MEGTTLSQDETESVARVAMDKLEKEVASLTAADQAALEASDGEQEEDEDAVPPYVMRRRAAKLVSGLAGTAVCIGLAVLVMKYGPEGLAKFKAWRAASAPAPAAAAASAAQAVPK